ncbi:Hypothetical predicted protein [Olea europaea subsp. europaea]|uniref:Uncharacterized protein n=1 Tax=Olea europaea subsp. europaea TaxID=158383 RepID=A0A8S0UFT3_OLEEU|nr:Hypothetical predicted protein [Olea europaea subsp. europaea]
MQPDFQASQSSFWDMVCRLCPRYGTDATLFSGTSRQFLGPGLHSMFGTRLGHGRDAARFLGIFGQFLGTLCQRCLGYVLGTTGMQPDFQAFLRSFWDIVCRPYPGRRTQPDFFDISRKLLGHGEQDMSRTQLDFQAFLYSFWDTMCKPCSGCVHATASMQPDFQAFLGSFLAWCAGHVRDASGAREGCSLISRHF